MSTYPIEFGTDNDTDMLSLEEQFDTDPRLELISVSETTKVYYDKGRGMYLVLFLSTEEVYMFDEY